MTLVHQAFRFELDPNDRTRSSLCSHAGASRFAYNWGLCVVTERIEAARVLTALALRQGAKMEEAAGWARELVGPVPWSLPALRRLWNEEKAEVAPWWEQNSKEAYSSGLDALARALKAFFDSRKAKRAGEPVGFPKRKSRRARWSCRFTTGAIAVVDDRHVKLPRLGCIRTKEPTTKLGTLVDEGRARVLSAAVSEEATRWFVSFTCEVEREDAVAIYPEEVVGADWGITHLATLSTGEVVENPKALNRYQKKLRTLQKELSRRQAGSRRHRRTKRKLARTHRKVKNVRGNAVHELTTKLAATYGTVVIEDLNVKGMTASPSPEEDGAGGYEHNGSAAKAGLSRSILDASPGEVRRQCTYKLTWHHGNLVVAPRFFPSTKRCSSCGATKTKLPLEERTFSCDHCGLVIDRDLNAALNLASYGRQPLVAASGTETLNARGGDLSPVKREDGMTVTAAGQPVAA